MFAILDDMQWARYANIFFVYISIASTLVVICKTNNIYVKLRGTNST